jgi:hypothetical protein
MLALSEGHYTFLTDSLKEVTELTSQPGAPTKEPAAYARRQKRKQYYTTLLRSVDFWKAVLKRAKADGSAITTTTTAAAASCTMG